MMKKMKMKYARSSYWTAGVHREGTHNWAWQPDLNGDADMMAYTVRISAQRNLSARPVHFHQCQRQSIVKRGVAHENIQYKFKMLN